MERGSKMSALSTSGLSVELLLRVIDLKYGYLTFTFTFTFLIGSRLCSKRFSSRNSGFPLSLHCKNQCFI